MQQSAFEASAQRFHLQHRGCVKTDAREAPMRPYVSSCRCGHPHAEPSMQKLTTALLRQSRAGNMVDGCCTRWIVFTCQQTLQWLAEEGRQTSNTNQAMPYI